MKYAALVLLAAAPSLFAQMGVTIGVSNPTPVPGGAAFAYTIVATNTTPFNVYFQLNTQLPPGILYSGVSVSSPTASVSCVGPAYNENGSIVCSNPSFPASGSVTITLVCTVAANIPSGIRVATVDVFPRTTGQSAPATASVQVALSSFANLQISTTATAQTVLGGLIAYNIAIANQGNSSALNTIVTDTLPPGVSFESVIPAGAFAGSCSFRPATNQVVCTAPAIPTGTSEITIVARASTDQASPPSVTNTVSLFPGNAATTGPTQLTAATTVVH